MTLFFNADGTRNWAYTGGQWRVAEDTIKFLSSNVFELQGNSLTLHGLGEFTRSDSGAKSGLVGTWVGGQKGGYQYKLVLNADSTFSWGAASPKTVGNWRLIGDTISDGPGPGLYMWVAALQSSGQELALKKLQQNCADPSDQRCRVQVWADTRDGTKTYTRVKP